MTRKKLTLVGAAVGLAAFLFVGLLPSMLYGGYAAVMLASALFGAPAAPTLGVRVLVVAGMVVGVSAGAALFALAGAAVGAALGALVKARGGGRAPKLGPPAKTEPKA